MGRHAGNVAGCQVDVAARGRVGRSRWVTLGQGEGDHERLRVLG